MEQLLFLAGLVHDAGKATYGWQEYILKKEKGLKAPRVPHSHVGSCIFFWAAYELLNSTAVSSHNGKETLELVLWITTDIASHHGVLADISDTYPPWEPNLTRDRRGRLLADADLESLVGFVNEETGYLRLTAEGFDRWFGMDGGRGRWSTAVCGVFGHMTGASDSPLRLATSLVRVNTSRLISADRLSAAGCWGDYTPILTSPEASSASLKVAEYCRSQQAKHTTNRTGLTSQVVWRRDELQKHSLKEYDRHPDASIFSLQLPTGMGKTICSLKIALSAVRNGRCRRIVYVAPYLSILSNATSELRNSTGFPGIMQHDSITKLDALVRGTSGDATTDFDSEQSFDLLALESWNAPIVTTTFNQFFRALFPRTAQHTMRLKALENSFIIMDELQSIDTAKWKLFLTMLEALTSEVNAQVLLVTATLPDTQGGLSQEPVELGASMGSMSRYQVDWNSGCVDSRHTAEMAMSEHDGGKSVAVILNTIQDAYEVYAEVLKARGIDPSEANREPDGVVVLSGLMTSLHKSYKIDLVRRLMKTQPVLVICTQVLEAGVNLSFDLIIRAIAPLPFLIQAAGRVNRHAERGGGTLKVINYSRADGVDSSRYIYDRDDLELTRAMLDRLGKWSESDSGSLCREFYHTSFQKAQREALLSYLQEANAGRWSRLGGLEPFGGSAPTAPVFVAYNAPVLRPSAVQAMGYLGVGDPEQLWQVYTDPAYMKEMSLAERRSVLALLQFYAVSISHRLASTQYFYQVREKPFLRLTSEDSYREDTGLMHLVHSDSPPFL